MSVSFVCSSGDIFEFFKNRWEERERGPKRGRFPFWLPAGKSRKQGARMPAGNLMMERSFVSSPPAKGGDQFSLDSYSVGLPCYFLTQYFRPISGFWGKLSESGTLIDPLSPFMLSTLCVCKHPSCHWFSKIATFYARPHLHCGVTQPRPTTNFNLEI